MNNEDLKREIEEIENKIKEKKERKELEDKLKTLKKQEKEVGKKENQFIKTIVNGLKKGIEEFDKFSKQKNKQEVVKKKEGKKKKEEDENNFMNPFDF